MNIRLRKLSRVSFHPSWKCFASKTIFAELQKALFKKKLVLSDNVLFRKAWVSTFSRINIAMDVNNKTKLFCCMLFRFTLSSSCQGFISAKCITNSLMLLWSQFCEVLSFIRLTFESCVRWCQCSNCDKANVMLTKWCFFNIFIFRHRTFKMNEICIVSQAGLHFRVLNPIERRHLKINIF